MLRGRYNVRLLGSNFRAFSSANSDGVDNPNNRVSKYNELRDVNPIKRTLQLLKSDLKKIGNVFTPKNEKNSKSDVGSPPAKTVPPTLDSYLASNFQTHCDVLVIGGGGVGSSIAYWLKKKARDGLNVVVVERDPTYKCASTVLSVGGLRQQFSLPENIQMSLYGADFIRDAKMYLGDVNLNFTPHGYLLLASQASAETLRRNSQLQNELGARNELLTPERLKLKFPWINTEGLALGCHGLEKEGWFDPWALLMGYKIKAKEYGAHFVNGEVIDFGFTKFDEIFVEGDPNSESGYTGIDRVVIRMNNGELRTIKFAICVLAAGADSGKVARLAKIGNGSGILRVPVPVEPRKRFVYVINTQGSNAPGLNSPLLIDTNGTYFRRDGLGGNYLCGRSPSEDCEPNCDNLDVDHDYFESDIWPTLAHRVPAFESAKVTSSWAGFYECNMYDENGIIGLHAYYNNLYIATGFSGHGIQQTPAVGRAISELIIDGRYRTIDLTRLGFDRLIVDQPMFESNIV